MSSCLEDDRYHVSKKTVRVWVVILLVCAITLIGIVGFFAASYKVDVFVRGGGIGISVMQEDGRDYNLKGQQLNPTSESKIVSPVSENVASVEENSRSPFHSLMTIGRPLPPSPYESKPDAENQP